MERSPSRLLEVNINPALDCQSHFVRSGINTDLCFGATCTHKLLTLIFLFTWGKCYQDVQGSFDFYHVWTVGGKKWVCSSPTVSLLVDKMDSPGVIKCEVSSQPSAVKLDEKHFQFLSELVSGCLVSPVKSDAVKSWPFVQFYLGHQRFHQVSLSFVNVLCNCASVRAVQG